MQKPKDERLLSAVERPAATKINPEEDFSPLGGYQPRKRLAGDFIIPSGGSKAIPAQTDAGASGQPQSSPNEDKREPSKTKK